MFSCFRWTIQFRFDGKLWSSLVMWVTRQTLQICSREMFFLKKCYSTKVWQQWRSKIERVAPEVCVLLLFPLRGKGAGTLTYGTVLRFHSIVSLSYQQEKWTWNILHQHISQDWNEANVYLMAQELLAFHEMTQCLCLETDSSCFVFFILASATGTNHYLFSCFSSLILL